MEKGLLFKRGPKWVVVFPVDEHYSETAISPNSGMPGYLAPRSEWCVFWDGSARLLKIPHGHAKMKAFEWLMAKMGWKSLPTLKHVDSIPNSGRR